MPKIRTPRLMLATHAVAVAAVMVSICVSSTALGQSSAGAIPVSSATKLPPRQLAEGVLTVISPDPMPEDTATGPITLDFVKENDQLAWLPPTFPDSSPFFAPKTETLLALSTDVTLRHPVFQLEFAFKPVRTIEVDMLGKDGKARTQLVWYLLYRVRYLGDDLTPKTVESDSRVEVPTEPRRTRSRAVLFTPKFELIAQQNDQVYIDQTLPAAVRAIARRERVGAPIYDTVEMLRRIPLATATEPNEFWGVATWANIDPRTDFFTVAVEGITNGFKIVDRPNGREFEKRALMINFWRPGDAFDDSRDEIRLGVPAYEDPSRMQYALDQLGIPERIAYYWTYK
jgi:hypothetical protein